MSVERHEIHEESVGAYLLGALSETERHNFEHHLSECHVCAAEVERLRPAADALPRSVTPLRAPDRLKAAIMTEVEADVRERQPSARPSAIAALRQRLTARGSALAGMRPAVAWVSAAFVLAVGVVAGMGVAGLTDDGPRTVVATADESRVPLANGNLVVPAGMGDGAILNVHGMPSLDARQTYQVWVRRNGEIRSQGLFSVGEDGTGAAAVSDNLENADAVMVTREPAGGARAPSEKPVLTVTL